MEKKFFFCAMGKRFVMITCLLAILFSWGYGQSTDHLYAKVKRIEGQGNGGNWLNLTEATRDSIMAGAPWKVQTLEYEAGTTPVQVRVYNPVDLKNYDYVLKINPVRNATDTSLVDTSSHWVLEWYQNETLMGSYTSHYSIGDGREEFLEGHGIAITVKNHPFGVRDNKLATFVKNNGGGTYRNNAWYAQPDLVGSLVKYAGGTPWLGGVQDADVNTPGNWVRAGNYKATSFWDSWIMQDGAEGNYMLWRKEDFFNLYINDQEEKVRGFMDYYGQFDHIADGTWAPYVISSPYDGGPKANYITPDNQMSTLAPTPSYYNFTSLQSLPSTGGYNQTLTNLYSVDIVLTPDQSKWTRAIVLESGAGTAENEYKVAQHFNGQTYYNIRHEPKNCPSVDKNGNPDNSGTTGFGWFPGYAINVETGERLNIMFAENSEDEYNRGNDMIFNPTNVYAFKKDAAGALVLDANGQPIPMSRDEYDSLYLNIYEHGNSGCHPGEPLNGGRHYVYVCGSSGNTANTFYRSQNRQRNLNDNNQIVTVSGQSVGGTFTGTDNEEYLFYDCGVYDEGRWLKEKFNTFVNETNLSANLRKNKKMQVFNNVMWTGIPMPAEGEEQHWLANDATVQIRVSRPYMFYTSAVGTGPENPTNQNAPVFTFNTNELSFVQNVELYDIEEDINIKNNRLDVNNVDAPVSPHAGAWFFNDVADYFVPKGTPKTPYFCYSLWLGGLDDNGSLHVAAERFNQLGKDTWPGPLSLTNASIDNATMMKWNRTFKITRAEVTECMANYQNPEYIIPQDVRDWPAHGDTMKGQAWNLAPFVDVDGNNVYEPEHGDYPDFPGDMAQFVIFNDNYAAHTESGGAPLGTETHVMAYAYDSPGDTIMNNTIFMKYKIFNRSQTNYHNTYIGLWSDWDLGYANDDYVACDIMKNSAYCYNGTSVDGYGQDWAYGENWPVQTITLISGPLMPADGLDNPAYTDSADCSLFINQGLNDYAVNGTGFGDGIADNERYGLTGFLYHNNDDGVMGDPRRAQDYYSFMMGRWKGTDTADFGPHLKYGYLGHPEVASTDIDCRFMFYGNTDSRCNFATYGVEVPDSLYGAQGWTEMNNDYTVPYDRRGLASAGPFNLEAGGMQEFEICLTTIPHELAVTRGDISLASLEDVDNQYRPQIFVPAITFVQHENICEGETFEFFGQICDTTGIYRHYVRNVEYNNLEPDTVYLLYLTREPLYTLFYDAVLPRHGYSNHGFSIPSSQTGHIGTRMYTHTYTSAHGCDSSVVLILEVRMDAGVEDYNQVESFRIYPNPTAEYVTIEVDDVNLIQNREPITVFDLSGKLLQSKPLTGEMERIDLGGYPSGVYLIKIGRNVSKVIKK